MGSLGPVCWPVCAAAGIPIKAPTSATIKTLFIIRFSWAERSVTSASPAGMNLCRSVDIPHDAVVCCCSPRLRTRGFFFHLASKPSSRSDRDELQLPRHRASEKQGIIQDLNKVRLCQSLGPTLRDRLDESRVCDSRGGPTFRQAPLAGPTRDSV